MELAQILAEVNTEIADSTDLRFVDETSLEFVGGGTITNAI